jgi:ATP-binding cassette subfamily B protein
MSRLLVPEVVQTSAMDCGPAVLKSALEGFGIPVSYGRLREACQTDVDGTSIDALEQVAGLLGLEAEQVMEPVDHLLLSEAEALPAIVVVLQPGGLTHFVLLWRRIGPLVQVMDPAVGRRWLSRRRLLAQVYVHKHRIPAAGWREWAGGAGLQRPLARRLRGLGCDVAPLIEQAARDPGWGSLARLDAATRLVESLVQSGGVRAGGPAQGVLRSFLANAAAAPNGQGPIPEKYWAVRPAPSHEEEEQVFLKGAVLVRLVGRKGNGLRGQGAQGASEETDLPDLVAALADPGERPGRTLLRLAGGTGWLSWLLLAAGLLLSAAASVLEVVFLRGLFELGRLLGLIEQRMVALACLAGFGAAVLLLELGVLAGLARMGRRLEVRLRQAFLEKLPRLHDRYFQSRPASDMAERSHSLHQVRSLPRLAGRFVRAALVLALTVAALAWLDPASGPLALAAAFFALAVPLAALPLLLGLDLRVRTHAGALARFDLDVLLGLTAVRAHGAEQAVRREHEALLVEWNRASRLQLAWVVGLEGLQTLIGFGLAGLLLVLHVGRAGDAGGLLLLGYWALNLPVLGEEIALLVRQYPLNRNVTLRLLEPLGAPCEEGPGAHREPAPSGAARGVALSLHGVTVRAGGHTILDGVELDIQPGSHVAIVGASGAGKSSLLGLLLGWHRAAAGEVRIDGEPLDAGRLERLRGETAWVDPSVHLWNASLIDNLLYGGGAEEATGVGEVVENAGLTDVLRRLPEGLQTPLGEGGARLSGGQGQRVRFGRALVRRDARLVLLDEPFRGLDRQQRHILLRQARRVWRRATLLCVTHDVSETQNLARVLVVEGGRVVEDGCPKELAATAGSRYGALLEAEEMVRAELWSSDEWRRVRLERGKLKERATERANGCLGCHQRLTAIHQS